MVRGGVGRPRWGPGAAAAGVRPVLAWYARGRSGAAIRGAPCSVAWKKIRKPSKQETAAFSRAFGQRARFLVDEHVSDLLAGALRDRGWNERTVEERGLRGRPDEQVLAAAFKEDRVLLTQDADFLDEGRFPPHRNPGIVVLPGGSGDVDALVEALATLLPVVGAFREPFEGTTSAFLPMACCR